MHNLTARSLKLPYRLLVFSFVLLAMILAGGKQASAADKAQVEKVIAEATAAREKANSIDGEWRDTAKFIKQAKAAMAAGDYKKALSLATKAKHQGELGYAQAAAQKGKILVPSYLQRK